MKRNPWTGILTAAALAASVACAHGNGASGKDGVRVVANAQDVAGCEKLSQVKLSGTWTSGAGKEELENLVRSKGGNVLLLPNGSTDSGTAYRCAGATVNGS
jgi:hypothetical protein